VIGADSELSGSDASTAAATRRVVLIGASNLTKGIGTVLHTAYRAWGKPLAVLTALGHGRSYGMTNSVLGRRLPGILECGLWSDLARNDLPTAALVTDIGNDLLYEASVDTIAQWVQRCFDRLVAARARTVVTLLPADNLQTLSRARYTLLRSVLFPFSRLSWEEARDRALALNERLRSLANERNFGVVVQRAEWYGFDPIHIKRACRPEAWRQILAAWTQHGELPLAARGPLKHTLYLQSRVPAERRLWGLEQRAMQPSARLGDGTTVSIY
jgi:hypothetical protein